MTEEPLYERVGQDPMTKKELLRAIDAYRADHPDMDEMHFRAVEGLLRTRDAKAHERAAEAAEARRAGTTTAALRRAKAEAKARERMEREQRELAAARSAIGDEPGVIRRPPGRPGWTAATFHGAYREARDRAGGGVALDKEIAAAWPISLKRFQELVRKWGRPT
jgi:hypothetical protein